MELDFFTFVDIDAYNKFVRKQKAKGIIIMPVSVLDHSMGKTIYFYKKQPTHEHDNERAPGAQ